MAVNGGMLTLVDMAKRKDPSGRTAAIVEIMNQTLEMGKDAIYLEGNRDYGHQVSTRTYIPRPTWVGVGEGLASTNTEVDQDVEVFGRTGEKSDVPKEVAEDGGMANVNQNLLDEATGILHGIEQEWEETTWYGNRGVSPKEFNGFHVRYNDLSGPTADQIVDGGGESSDCTSMWLVGWGPMTTFMGIPKGSKAGIEIIKRGLQDVTDVAGTGTTGKTHLVYRTYFYKNGGLVVRDPRSIVRGANIDVPALRTKTAASDLTEMLIKMWHRARRVMPLAKFWRIYMNSTLSQYFDLQRRDDVTAGGGLSYVNVDGVDGEAFRKIPVRISDSLLNSETAAA